MFWVNFRKFGDEKMCIQFVTHFNDYKNMKLSKRTIEFVSYKIKTTLCLEKVEKQYGKIKRHEQLAHQTCWKLN